MNRNLTRLIFDQWMEQYHPYYALGWGLIFLTEMAYFIFALATIFFAAYWIKAWLFALGLAVITYLVRKAHSNIIRAEFNSGEYPLKRNQ